MFFVNVWQFFVVLVNNFVMVMVGCVFGGLLIVGGFVIFGMIVDMWEVNDQQYVVVYVVFFFVGGFVFGFIVGGFMEEYLDWRYVILNNYYLSIGLI